MKIELKYFYDCGTVVINSSKIVSVGYTYEKEGDHKKWAYRVYFNNNTIPLEYNDGRKLYDAYNAPNPIVRFYKMLKLCLSK